MTQSKLTMAAATLLFLGAVGVAAVVLGQQPPTQPPRGDTPERAAGATPGRLDANGDPLPPGALARLGSLRFRHSQAVNAVRFTADDRVVASAGKDGTLRLWEATTGKELQRFDVSPQTASFGLSADGKTVAAPVPEGGDRTTIRVWDAATGRETHRVEPGTAVSHVLLTSDGQALVWGDTLGVHLWDLNAGKEVRVFRTPPGIILGLAMSADGKTVAASGPDHAVRVWEAGSGKELYRVDGARGTQVYVALSPDGQTLATRASNESDVRLWDVATGREKVALILKNAMLSLGRDGKEIPATFENAIAFSADGQYVATTISQSNGWSVVIWDVANGHRVKVAPIPTMGVSVPLSAVALSSDGRTLATGGEIYVVRVIKLLGTGGGWDYVGPHEGPVRTVAVTPDGKTIVTSCDFSSFGFAYLWDTAGRPILCNLSGNCLVFSPNGKQLASFVRGDFRISLWPQAAGWDVPGGHHQQILEGHTKRVGAVGFTADGATLISWGLDRTFRHWDVATAKEVRQTAVPAEGVYDVAFSRDGQQAAGVSKGSGKDSTVVYLWDPATGKEIHRWEVRGCVVSSMAYSPDGRTLAIAGKGEAATTVRLLNTADGKETKQWTDPTHQQILAVTFSPDGKTLASGDDRWLRLWDVATAGQRAVYTGHQGPITSIAFAPDGKAVYTGSEDTTALIWGLSTP
jgi:WD40 repeat protein